MSDTKTVEISGALKKGVVGSPLFAGFLGLWIVEENLVLAWYPYC